MGKRALCMQSFSPTQPNKNEPGAWNPPLPRDKGLPQPALGLSTCVGLSFPVSDSLCTPLFCLCVCVIKHLDNPITISLLWVILRYKRVACKPMALCWLPGVTAGHGVQHPLLKLIFPLFFPMWAKHCSILCLTALCFPWWLQYQDAVGRSVYSLCSWWKATAATCSTVYDNSRDVHNNSRELL